MGKWYCYNTRAAFTPTWRSKQFQSVESGRVEGRDGHFSKSIQLLGPILMGPRFRSQRKLCLTTSVLRFRNYNAQSNVILTFGRVLRGFALENYQLWWVHSHLLKLNGLSQVPVRMAHCNQRHCITDKIVMECYRVCIWLQLYGNAVIQAKLGITKVQWPAHSVAEHVKDGNHSHHMYITETLLTDFRIPLWKKLGTIVAIRMGCLTVPGVTQLTRMCDGSIVLLNSVQVSIRALSQYKDHLIYVWRFPC